MEPETSSDRARPVTKADTALGARQALRVGGITLLLRVLTLASKLALTIAIARWLTPAEFGHWGLIVGVAAIGMVIAGLELYAVTQRDYIRYGSVEQARALRDLFVVWGAMYLILAAIAPVFVLLGVATPWLAAVIWLLIVLESLSHECFRILIALDRIIAANWVMFVRAGAWAYVAIALLFVSPSSRTIATLIAFWLVSCLLSIILAIFFVRGFSWKEALRKPIDRRWLWRSLLQSWPFMISAALALLTVYADRFILAAVVDASKLGVFTFYATIAIAISTVVTATVSHQFLPRITVAWGESAIGFKQTVRRFAKWNALIVIAMLIGAAVGIHVILLIVARPDYAEHLATYYLLILAVGLRGLADVPSYVLYSAHRERTLLWINIMVGTIALAGTALLAPRFGIIGAAFAAITSAVVQYAAMLWSTTRLLSAEQAA